MSARILIATGGTGGHVIPGLAVARALRERGATVVWLGTRRGLESDLVPAAGFPLACIDVEGLRGRGVGNWLQAPFRVGMAILQALLAVRRLRPDVVLGMGGFVSGPGGVAAKLLWRPLLIHEQNAIAGMTNRLLSRVATTTLEAFPGSLPGALTVGNPVRPEIAAVAPPAQRYVDRGRQLRLLVVGGSRGAQALNELLPQALALLSERQRPKVLHQTGRDHFERTEQAYGNARAQGELKPFLDDMAKAYEWADLVVCRAGALTITELATVGVPALLVPFPFAVDDHQRANARYLSDAGAARLLPQSELTAERLAAQLGEFADDAANGRSQLLTMAEAAHKLARNDAVAEVVAACLQAAGVAPP